LVSKSEGPQSTHVDYEKENYGGLARTAILLLSVLIAVPAFSSWASTKYGPGLVGRPVGEKLNAPMPDVWLVQLPVTDAMIIVPESSKIFIRGELKPLASKGVSSSL
jgi:hypothetical protein